MIRMIIIFLMAVMSVGSASASVPNESETAELAQKFIRIYSDNAQISTEAVYQLSESIGDAFSYVILKKPRWRGTSQSLLICATKILNSGVCKELSGRPSPWMGPQEFIDMVWPDKNAVVKNISYYPSNSSIYLFYSFVEKPKEQLAVGDFQDPTLSAADIPWNKISNKSTKKDKKVKASHKKSKSVPAIKKKPTQKAKVVKKPKYKDLYVPGKEVYDYDPANLTVRLASFKGSRDARVFRRTYGVKNSYTITTRKNDERIHHVYFGIFPSEEDVYKALETLPGVLIREKPTLHSLAQVQLEDHNYEEWKRQRIEELRKVVSSRRANKSE